MEKWEPTRDWFIGWCGKTEREAEETGWVELRALLKAQRERQNDAWRRARMIAHSVYLFAPKFAKGVRKENDPRKFYPLHGDEDDLPAPTVVHLTAGDIKELNRIKTLIR